MKEYLLLSLLFFTTSVNVVFSATAVERECRYEDFTLTATPEKGVYGEEVNLSVSASNLPENGLVYQWLKWGIDDASGREAFVPISITTEGNLSYSIDQDTTTIIVVAEACVAQIIIKEISLGLEPIDRVCNDIILQPVVKLGVDETILYKWQSSPDGISWKDVKISAIKPIEVEGLDGCFKVTITENLIFRLAEVDASGAETGRYSDETELYEAWDLEQIEGCFSSSEDEEGVLDDFVWPTIFTPMLVDGFNDDFVMGMQPAIALKIFDRYGNLVIETTDGWDGKYANGEYAMPDVYYYIATLPNGEIFKGNVELLNENIK